MGARAYRGAVTVELTIIVPVLVLVLATFTAGWRIWSARTEVTHAAQAGARAASLAHDGAAARAAAERAVAANLVSSGVVCRNQTITLDVGDFAKPAGMAGSVAVTVRCSVPLADLLVPGLPGSVTTTSTATAVLDTFRARQP